MESKFQYYKRVVKGASFNKFFSVVEEAHKRCGKESRVPFLRHTEVYEKIQCRL